MIEFLTECFNSINDTNEHSCTVGEGFSGKKILSLLSRISSKVCDENNVYLEVGVFRGLTLLTVANSVNQSLAYGIDNFSQFDPNNENYSFVNDQIKKHDLSHKVKIINNDFEKALISLDKYITKNIGLYFIDGPHDYRSQLLCLLLAKKYLSPNCVIIIDDCNYEHVRQANYDFLVSDPEYKLIYEAYTYAHPKNMDKKRYNDEAINGFWNGINVIFRDSERLLEPMYPSINRNNSSLYSKDHIVHSSKYACLSPQALKLSRDILDFKILKFFRNLITILKYKRMNSSSIGFYDGLNTYSSELPSYNIHQQLK